MKSRLCTAVVVAACGLMPGPQPEADGTTERVALLGCIRQNDQLPALEKYVALNADLHLWLGDNVYADAKEDAQVIQRCYETLSKKPGFRELRSQGQHMATWDDHDFGTNDSGRHYPLKRQSQTLFVDFWQLQDVIPNGRDGIYYSRMFQSGKHRLQVIMLDVRFFRDDPDEDADVLGEAQWKWLAEQLRAPADLRMIVSGFQLLLPADAASETWAKFPAARKRLFKTIRDSLAERVVFIAGDQHYGEVCRKRGVLDFDAVELQFAGLNQIEAAEFNRNRVSTVCRSLHSYAFIDIQWDDTKSDVPHLKFVVADAETDQMEVQYRVNFSELELKVQRPDQPIFGDSLNATWSHEYPQLRIRYTIDGSEPKATSPLLDSVSVSDTATIRARFFQLTGQPRSKIFEQTYRKQLPLKALEKRPTNAGLKFSYYQGDFKQLPKFERLTASKFGTVVGFEVDKIAERDDHYAIRYEGFFDAPYSGTYEFFTASDDGSKLYLHNQLVVDNGGSHSTRKRTGYAVLEKGLHPIRIDYFEDYMGQKLKVGYRPCGSRGIPYSPTMLQH